MYALQISSFGKPSEVLELVTLPDPHDPIGDEVLIGMEYAPISNSDLLTVQGRYGVLPPLPAIIGMEGIGHILAVGKEVNDFKIGDRVLLPLFSSSWREKIILPSKGLVPLPQDADVQQLSLLGINPPTGALLLSEYVDLNPGDWVIQNASNSGVGRSVIAFAKDRGLRTVNLVRRQELIDELLAAGGDVVLVEGTGAGISKQIAEATDNAKMKLAIDSVGGEAMLSLSNSLAPGGTLVVYSAVSGKPGLASFVDLIFRNVTIRGFWLNSPEFRASPKIAEAIKAGARLIAEGKLHMPVAATYPLTEAREAVAHAQKGRKVLFKLS